MAKCSGPTSMAFCSFIDRHDGTFELVIKPQEPGLHTVEIKYGDEPVPGKCQGFAVSIEE